jgi:hypothetical protein
VSHGNSSDDQEVQRELASSSSGDENADEDDCQTKKAARTKSAHKKPHKHTGQDATAPVAVGAKSTISDRAFWSQQEHTKRRSSCNAGMVAAGEDKCACVCRESECFVLLVASPLSDYEFISCAYMYGVLVLFLTLSSAAQSTRQSCHL